MFGFVVLRSDKVLSGPLDRSEGRLKAYMPAIFILSLSAGALETLYNIHVPKEYR